MKIRVFILALVLATAFSCKTTNKTENSVINIEELGYGSSAAEILSGDKLKNSPSGQHLTTGYYLNIIEKTDVIKARIGVQFGVEYLIKSQVNEIIPITITWRYPKGMKNKKGENISETSYSITKMTNQYTYSNYTIGDENEVVRGDWTLEVHYKSKLLLKRTFHLM